jgi:hypothetical protein
MVSFSMLTNRLNKLRVLSRPERRLLSKSVLLLPFIHAALLLVGYSRLRRWMERQAPLKAIEPPLYEAAYIPRARDIARIVSIAARHGIYRATCLRRSLLVWWFLRREGIRGEVCFGVRMRDGRLEAHAWVEYNGVVVNDSPAVRAQYQPLYHALPSTDQGL